MSSSTSASSLVVPLALWTSTPPTHCITALHLTRDHRTLVTASRDGELLLWDVNTLAKKEKRKDDDEEEDVRVWEATPRHMLVGHTSCVRCVAKAGGGPVEAEEGVGQGHVVTADDAGHMIVWDVADGRAIESRTMPNLVHTAMQAYKSPGGRGGSSSVRLFCCGHYAEIVVLDPYTLEILLKLSSRVQPDWVAAFHVLRPRNRPDDVVLALTTAGTVKVWTLNGDETVESTILENESKEIRCLNALSMTCCVYNMRTVLVVCSSYWNVYDAGDFTCLLSVESRRNERWIGGEFVTGDRVCAWTDCGQAHLYKLPTNCIVESKDFHNKRAKGPSAMLFCTLIDDVFEEKDGNSQEANPLRHECPPSFKYLIFSQDGKWLKYLMMGDFRGRLVLWKLPDTPQCAAMQLRVEQDPGQIAKLRPLQVFSLSSSWKGSQWHPRGLLDHVSIGEESEKAHVTASLFLPVQCKLVCGCADGSIVIVPATQAIIRHLLSLRHEKRRSQHQVLLGHYGRVTSLLYPCNFEPRYDMAHLVSGSSDFTVCLWDIYKGALLHRFASQAGEISSLHLPPPNVSPRVQNCICSIAKDHSVALLSLKEKRCILLASRHAFPVTSIKWRPLDDFLIVLCRDGAVFVWQMETGHLDRVAHGTAASEILSACDEVLSINLSDNVGANPALHFFRGLRHRNLAAVKLATKTGISNVKGKTGPVDAIRDKHRAFPLVIDGFRTNPKDDQGHLLFFDVEALIVQLLSEEYQAMSPGTLEAQGFTNQCDYEKIWPLTKPTSPDAVKKITGFLNKVKDKADDRINAMSKNATSSPETQRRVTGIMAKVKEGAEKAKEEIERARQEFEKGSSVIDSTDSKSNETRPNTLHLEINITLEIGQLLLSLLHAWGLDRDLDKVAVSKLGLLQPLSPLCFGIVSKSGSMSLALPTWQPNAMPSSTLEETTTQFTSLTHWQLSSTLTTHHLLSVIAVTNTLVSVSNASFVPEQEHKRKLVRQATHGAMALPSNADASGQFARVQEQIKQAWSLLSTLHCLLLSNKLKQLGQSCRKPLVELLAQKWQDRCLQVRLAAQELLIAELRQLGSRGRRHLVDVWGSYLPKYGDPPFQQVSKANDNNNNHDYGKEVDGDESSNGVEDDDDEEEEEEDDLNDDLTPDAKKKNNNALQARRNQSTSVILLGVIGALFDLEAEKEKKEVALGNQLTRLTAKALMYLLLSPGSSKQPINSALRRAAIDLIGRGFALWEPHLEVSKVLLGLLELTCEADWWVPSGKYGLPLTPKGDSCRTARHALLQIARLRPLVFITSVAKEIARFNNLANNAQALNVNLNKHVLFRSKGEILHLMELLILECSRELTDLIVDVVDVVLHCIDPNHLKGRLLADVFVPIAAFPQVSHCLQSRRIAVGAKSGQVALYDLRSSRVQLLNAHQGVVSCVAFSVDGKNLATYSCSDNKVCFWQTTTAMFGLGNAQTKCVKSLNTPPLLKQEPGLLKTSPTLKWTAVKTIVLNMPDGKQHRFNC